MGTISAEVLAVIPPLRRTWSLSVKMRGQSNLSNGAGFRQSWFGEG